MPSKEFWARQFELLVQSPAAWWTLGDRLRIAAPTLFGVVLGEITKPIHQRDQARMSHAIEHWSPASLLAGLAIENYAKGLIVQRESLRAKDGKLPPELPTNHHLKGLLTRAGIELDKSELVLVQILQQALTWRGRYPIPKNVEGMSPGHLIESWSAPRTVKTFERLCDRCEVAFDVVRETPPTTSETDQGDEDGPSRGGPQTKTTQ